MKTKIYSLIFTLSAFTLFTANAATFNTQAGGTIWSDPGTWTIVSGSDDDGIPDADDDVIILQKQSLDIDVNAECQSLVFNNITTGSGTTIALVYDNITFTVYGNVTLIGGALATRISNLTIGDGSSTGALMIVHGDVILNSSTNTKAVIDMSNGPSELRIGGNLSLTNATPRGTLLSSSDSKVTFNGTGDQTFAIGDNSGTANSIAYNDIEINKASGTAFINSAVSNIVNTSSISGSFTISSNSVLNNGGHDISGNETENFTMQSGSRLILTGTTGIPGGFLHNIDPSSTIEFAGAAQNITALNNNQSYGNINATNGNTKTITEAISVRGSIALSGNTTLASGGNLTLLSDAAGTARIAEIPAGSSVTGNVTVQRFIPASTRAYRYLSSAVNNSGSISFSQLIDNTYVTGSGGATNGFDNSPSNAASLYIYDETLGGAANSGWQAITNINNTINTGKGMSLFIRGSRNLAEPFNGQTQADDVTIDFTGTINSGQISPAITFSGGGADDGWNLVGNPYPSQIDWEASGWTKTNVSGTIYTYDPTNEVYATWDGATSVNGATRYIASGQAFFIKTTGSSPVLTFNESVKTTDVPSNFFRTNSNQNTLKLTLTSATRSDEAYIDMTASKSSSFSYEEDALKMINSKINISSFSSDNINAVINRYGALENNDTLWLNVSGLSGSYQLTFNNLASFQENPELVLVDLQTNTQSDITEGFTYNFTITSSPLSFGKRFVIIPAAAPLPVELLKFSGRAKDHAVELDWTTASEINNHHFTIERSADGISFREILTIPAAENGRGTNQYSAIDTKPFKGINYYRLISYDRNGTSHPSKTIAVSMNEADEATVNVYPNPVNDELNISALLDENAVIEISDLQGRIVSTIISNANTSLTKINTSELIAGVYVVHIKSEKIYKPVVFIKD